MCHVPPQRVSERVLQPNAGRSLRLFPVSSWRIHRRRAPVSALRPRWCISEEFAWSLELFYLRSGSAPLSAGPAALASDNVNEDKPVSFVVKQPGSFNLKMHLGHGGGAGV